MEETLTTRRGGSSDGHLAPPRDDAVRTPFESSFRLRVPRGSTRAESYEMNDMKIQETRTRILILGVETAERYEYRRKTHARDERRRRWRRRAKPTRSRRSRPRTRRSVMAASRRRGAWRRCASRWRRKPTPPRFARRSRAKPTRTPSPPRLSASSAPRPRARPRLICRTA